MNQPIDQPRGPLLWRLLGIGFAMVMRPVPEHRRYGAAVVLARLIAPLIPSMWDSSDPSPSYSDSAMTVALARVLNQLHRLGLGFTVPFRIEGPVELLSQPPRGSGIAVVGPLSTLNFLLIRFFRECNADTTVLSLVDQPYEIVGTPETVAVIEVGERSGFRVRRALRRGALVAGMIQTRREGKSVVEIETPAGPMLVASGVFRLAAASRARLCFAAIHLDADGTPVVVVDGPPPAKAREVDADMALYVDFVRREIARAGSRNT